MNFKTFKATYDDKSFVIEEDNPKVGVYLYIYQEGKCIKDFLQNDIEICKQIALRDYGVPFNAWILQE